MAADSTWRPRQPSFEGTNVTAQRLRRPHSTAFCEPLIHNGRTFLTNTWRANAFVQQYAAVNRFSFDKSERTQTRHLKKALQLPTAAESCCSPFTIREIDIAIHAMRSKGAAGPDDIPPTFLEALGPMAKTELLSIFNESFSKGVVPGICKEATILRLKKQANRQELPPPTDLSVSHPVLSRQWREWCTTGYTT